ncbi:ead/Ea22-like family protein [Citrobacter bitternis]|uniref:Ead/Ea22-like family protein n=1 Tax=Citrobacter bitternis TaxID=1585982 RepID=A0ABW1Q065_9ENTR
MTINSEQIQALKAAAESATPGEWAIQFGDEIYASDGVNHDQIAMLFSDNSARDAEFIAAANPSVVLSLLAERDADKAMIAESVVLFETLRQRIAELEREKDAMTAAALAMRDDMREARTLTVKFPEDWHFEECETEGCQNGALFSVGKAAKNLHLCEACAKEPANSRLSKTALPKRLPFRIAAGITLDVGE